MKNACSLWIFLSILSWTCSNLKWKRENFCCGYFLDHFLKNALPVFFKYTFVLLSGLISRSCVRPEWPLCLLHFCQNQWRRLRISKSAINVLVGTWQPPTESPHRSSGRQRSSESFSESTKRRKCSSTATSHIERATMAATSSYGNFCSTLSPTTNTGNVYLPLLYH